MKQEIYSILDFLSKIPSWFKNPESGNFGFYFYYNLSYQNCYAGIILGAPPRKHSKNKNTDLLAQVQDRQDWRCVCIYNLSESNAKVLEALIIKFLSIKVGLHNIGDTTIIKGLALNKRRERKWEMLISETFINGGYDINLIGG